MSKLTPHELAMKTVMDIERRKYLREKGKLEADSYIIEQELKASKRKSRIRARCYK